MGSGWANPRTPWLRGHPSLRITALIVSWVVPKTTPPGASTPLWATGTHGHPGTKLRHRFFENFCTWICLPGFEIVTSSVITATLTYQSKKNKQTNKPNQTNKNKTKQNQKQTNKQTNKTKQNKKPKQTKNKTKQQQKQKQN